MALFFWCPSSNLVLTLFLPLPPQNYLSCEGRDLMETFIWNYVAQGLSHSLHNVQLLVSICSHLLQEEASLMMVE